jgi:hypothetical protein
VVRWPSDALQLDTSAGLGTLVGRDSWVGSAGIWKRAPVKPARGSGPARIFDHLVLKRDVDGLGEQLAVPSARTLLPRWSCPRASTAVVASIGTP